VRIFQAAGVTNSGDGLGEGGERVECVRSHGGIYGGGGEDLR
jgi:hypothetical protein